jgi:NAD(P)H-hydrate epimerase
LKSEVRGFFRDVIETVNRLEKPVFAVDIPSGLHSDTGQPCGLCVFADATATFGLAKIGHRVHPGRQSTGNLRIVDIGIPPHIVSSVAPRQFFIDSQTAGSFLKPRQPDTHKGKNGHLLVVGGSTGKTGATAMASISAVRAGAGLVTLAIAKSLNPVLESMAMEVMSFPLPETDEGFIDESAYETIRSLLTDKSCLAIGPGLGVTDGLGRMTKQLVEHSPVPVVIDADGLNCLAEVFKEEKGLANSNAPLILTPHPGEMSRLTGISVKDIQNDRVEVARDFAQKHGVHVVLKGAATVSAHPDGAVDINSTGNPGMASGGMGDVLTGLIAGFVCQGYPSREAIALGVYLHGAAADELEKTRGPWGYMATDVMDAIPGQIAKILETVCN